MAKPRSGKRSDRATVSLPVDVVESARELSALASKNGWAALGVDRSDPPTITAIFEEAIRTLARAHRTRGK